MRRSPARPDWRPKGARPGSDFEMLKTQALDAFGTRYAICNLLFRRAPLRISEDMAAAFSTALNDWLGARVAGS